LNVSNIGTVIKKKHELIDESITKKINVANGICNGTNNQIVDNFLHVLEFSLLLNKKTDRKGNQKKKLYQLFFSYRYRVPENSRNNSMGQCRLRLENYKQNNK
jgi:hypothetical protein